VWVTKMVETTVLVKSRVMVLSIAVSASGVTVVETSMVMSTGMAVNGPPGIILIVVCMTEDSVTGPDCDPPPEASEMLTSGFNTASEVTVAISELNKEEDV
jgi:hypothetical protein